MSETWAWISGWGIRPERFRAAAESALPGREHLVLPPEPGAVDALIQSGATHFGGYSLGSLLLLDALPRLPESPPVLCLAPILSFSEEGGLGGRTPLDILEALQAKLAKKPLSALKLFYRLADLPDEPTDELPYSEASLAWGLDALTSMRVEPPLPDSVRAVLGSEDPLLDAEALADHFGRGHIVEGAHDYHRLFTRYRAGAAE